MVMDKDAIKSAVVRIAHEIIEKNKDVQDLVIIGIMTRGVYLARRISDAILEINGVKPAVGMLDITLYRDDLGGMSEQLIIRKTELPFDVTSKKVVLVDDVLYTGRTVRAALTELTDFGRPQFIQLAVLIDRGFRELPIRADYIGKNIPTSKDEVVRVQLEEVDGKDEVVIVSCE